MELRGHDHQVETVCFAPLVSYGAIRELAGIPVGFLPLRQRVELIMSSCQNTDRTKRPGVYVATGSRDKTIKLWDTQSGQMLKNLASKLHFNDVSANGCSRLDMTTGCGRSCSTLLENCYSLRRTTRRYECGSFPLVDVSRRSRHTHTLLRRSRGDDRGCRSAQVNSMGPMEQRRSWVRRSWSTWSRLLGLIR